MDILKKIVTLIIVSMFIISCGNESSSGNTSSNSNGITQSDEGP